MIHLFAWTYVFAINRRSPLSKAYLLYIGVLIIWLIVDIVGRIMFSPNETPLQYLRLMSVFWLYMGVGIMHFVYVFIDKKFDRVFKIFAWLYPLSLLISFSTNMTVVPSLLFLPTLLIVGVTPAIYSIYLIIHQLVVTKNEIFNFQLKLIIMGISCAVIVGIVSDVVPPYLGFKPLWRLGSAITCIQAFFILPAILKYHFISFPVGEMAFGLFTNANEAIIAIDNKGIILRTNNKANQLFNIHPENIQVNNITDYIKGYSHKDTFINLETVLMENYDISINISQTTLRFGGYEQGKVLIIRDVTERVQTALKLTKSEEKYRTLIESSSDIIYNLDISGNYVYVNPPFEKFSGYKIKDVIGMSSTSFVRPDFRTYAQDKFLKLYQQRKNLNDAGMLLTIPVISKDGTEYWMEMNVKLILDGDWVAGFTVASRDVTERFQAEEKLKASEDRYRKLVKYLPDAIVVHDGKTILFANDQAAELAGIKSGELLHGRPIVDFVHAENKEILFERFAKLFEGKSLDPIEVKLQNSDDNSFIVETQGVLIDFNNKPAIQTVFRDITEKKIASDALKSSEIRLRKLIETSPDGIAIHDFKNIYFINEAGADIVGEKTENIINKPFLKYINPEEKDRFKDIIKRLKKGERVSRFDVTVLRADGTEAIVEVKGTSTTHNGKPAILSFLRDVTDRIQAENEVIASRTRLNKAQKMAGLGSFQYNLITEKVIWSDTLYHIYGLDRKKYTTTNKKFLNKVVHPDDRKYVKELTNSAIQNNETNLDYFHKIVQPDGTEKIMHALIQINYDDKGEAVIINGSAQDVTEIINTRQKLEKSEKSYRELVELSPDAVLITDKKKILYVNKAFIKMMGGKHADDFIDKDIYPLVHPDSINVMIEDLEKLDKELPISSTQIKVFKLDGSLIHIDIKGMMTQFNDQQAVMCSIRDVTSRIVAEKQLKESELSLSKAQKIAQLGSWEENHQTGEVYWSSELKKIFGLTKSQKVVSGQFWEYIHPDDLDWMKQNWLQAENNMVFYKGTFRILLKDGTIKHLSEQAEFTQDSEGKLLKVIGTVHDVTQVSEYQNQLKNLSSYIQNLQEEERGRIAREIHDELGQNLTSINMDVDYLKARGTDGADSDIRNRLKSLSKLVNHTIKTTRRISQELRPGILDDLGLKSAIEWQVSQFRKRSDMEYKLNLTGDDENLSNEQATTIFRITQESLTNIARHAEATKVEVNLSIAKPSINLTIKDNGKGISENNTENHNVSFGIFSMKERASILGGELVIISKPKEGTSINVEIPIQSN